jgi:hypothetical protein
MYERLLASDQRLRESGKGAARSLYHSIPRHIKNMPFVDYFVGSKSADLYEAIFEVEDSRDFELFDDSEEDESSLRSPLASGHENSGSSSILEPRPHKRSTSLSKKSQSQPPRTRKVSALPPLSEPLGAGKILHLNMSTPLTRLFSQRFNHPSSAPAEILPDATNMDRLDSSVKRIEALLEDCRELPVRKLKDEMKELQVSQYSIIVV